MMVLASPGAFFWGNTLNDIVIGFGAEETILRFAHRDFSNYWLGGQLLLKNQQHLLFDQSTFQAAMNGAFGFELPIHNWSYPPHMLLILWPLGLLAYKSAFLAFSLTGFVFILVAVRVTQKHFQENQSGFSYLLVLVFLSPYLITQFAIGQNGFIFSGLMLMALVYRNKRPFLCAACLAFLTMKPQLGLLFPVLLLIERNYLVIVMTIIFGALLFVASVLLVGFDSWIAYFALAVPYQNHVMANWSGIFLAMMPTSFAAFRLLDFSANSSLIYHFVIAIPVLIVTVVSYLRVDCEVKRSLITSIATFVIVPYAFLYDLGAPMSMVAIVFVCRIISSPHSNYFQLGLFGAFLTLPAWMPIFAPVKALYFLPVVMMMILFVKALLIRGLATQEEKKPS